MDNYKLFSSNNINFLLISANVGTLFEKPEEIEETWLAEFLKIVKDYNAHFIALHCQEIGGKYYKAAFETTLIFFRKLANWHELKDFTVVQGLLDGDVEEPGHFTALGNIYFLHKCIEEAELFDFEKKEFFKPSSNEILFRNIAGLAHVRKEKFEENFFTECKWTRKGYCRVRWRICDKVIELVNVHLFHDDSNVKATQKTPSHYTLFRKRGIDYVMKKLSDEYPVSADDALFVFGDYNFRLDVKSIIESLQSSCQGKMLRSASVDDKVVKYVHESQDGNKSTDDEVIVHLEKKRFEINHDNFKPLLSHQKLRRFDIELSRLDLELEECDVTFPPTYPYVEEVEVPDRYMATRCPSWCDRILFSKSSSAWMTSQKSMADVKYNTIGRSACMGDHKPVFLAFTAPVKL